MDRASWCVDDGLEVTAKSPRWKVQSFSGYRHRSRSFFWPIDVRDAYSPRHEHTPDRNHHYHL